MKPRLAPVRVERERVLRTIVGLRPFRPAGFVVRSERVGEKTIVHNYGHGGAGVTLSWGTAQLAAEEVARAPGGPVAVLGGGAVGLATARTLQEAGRRVTIYAREVSPGTTSDIAGARIYPSDAYDPAVATPAFVASLWRVVRASFAVFSALPADAYGVVRRPTYLCRDGALPADSPLSPGHPIADLYPGLRDLGPDERPFPYPLVRTFESLFVETPIYLPALRHAFERAGGDLELRGFTTLDEVLALPEPVIVNCLGLGAGVVFGDRTIYPIKGQLTLLRPQPEVDYIALPPGTYMFPRKDAILLGGTFQHHQWSMEPDRVAEACVLAAHARFFGTLG